MEPENLTLNIEKLNRQALFCDENEDFRIPPEPDAGEQVTLRFRTAKNNADHVYYIEEGKTLEVEMEKADSDEMFDYYEHHFTVGEQVVCYRFRVEKGEEICHYNRLGAAMDTQSCFSFRITPGFHTPEWAKGAVMYQIFVDRFRCGDTNNNVETGEYVYTGWMNGTAIRPLWMWDVFMVEICRGSVINWIISSPWGWKSFISTLSLCRRPTTSTTARITTILTPITGKS